NVSEIKMENFLNEVDRREIKLEDLI
ncbi:hypothetical protein LCGC14_2363210, partial [marine sediment metagenome]